MSQIKQLLTGMAEGKHVSLVSVVDVNYILEQASDLDKARLALALLQSIPWPSIAPKAEGEIQGFIEYMDSGRKQVKP